MMQDMPVGRLNNAHPLITFGIVERLLCRYGSSSTEVEGYSRHVHHDAMSKGDMRSKKEHDGPLKTSLESDDIYDSRDSPDADDSGYHSRRNMHSAGPGIKRSGVSERASKDPGKGRNLSGTEMRDAYRHR